ncbi:hypothetical protein [Desulfoferula mesophila]|uniref:Lipoprotein SmpA/OmlA domain-containing protein n=1 Tax=Desulfoferula mesophila TaxID=3058419 RepID=A0AAU9EAK8_9BACT|nr:hypothetical protein FAK_00760 [Desulfoferula mesophilus]
MRKAPFGKALWMVLAALMLLGVACTSYDQATYDKIKTDMTREEVIGILGEPTESSGFSLGGLSGTSAVWKDKHGNITIQFLNNKVKAKSFAKP